MNKMTTILLFVAMAILTSCSNDDNSVDGGPDASATNDSGTNPNDTNDDSDTSANLPCDGDCSNGYYTACTCDLSNPCQWIADGFCDMLCAEISSNSFSDDADCACNVTQTNTPEKTADGGAEDLDGGTNILDGGTNDVDGGTGDQCTGDEVINLLVADAKFLPPMAREDSATGEGVFAASYAANQGKIVWPCVQIPCSGNWHIIGRTWKWGENDDSFYLKVGENPEIAWDLFQCSGEDKTWKWDYASAAANDSKTCDISTMEDPASFTLQEGSTTITIRGRELSDRIDQYPPAVAKLMLVTAPDNQIVKESTISVTGPTPVPANLVEMQHMAGRTDVPLTIMENPITYAGHLAPENVEGCEPFEPNAFAGKIALIDRGTCWFSEKITNAAAAGATAVVIINYEATPLFTMPAEGTTIPAILVSYINGHAIADWIAQHPNEDTTVQIYPPN